MLSRERGDGGVPHLGIPFAPSLLELGMRLTSTRSAMASMGIPRIGFCAEKHHLLSRFLIAVKEISELHRQQIRAVIEGDPNFTRFEGLLHRAAQRKDLAKYAFMTHAEGHGC
jgi:hypothetical protein